MDVLNHGKLCLLDIDSQGVKNVKKTDLNPLYIFIKPPNMQVLEQRLRCRGTETEEAIRKRLDAADMEMAYGDTPGNYDYVIVNDDLDVAYEQLKSIVEQRMRDNNSAPRSADPTQKGWKISPTDQFYFFPPAGLSLLHGRWAYLFIWCA